MYIPDGFRQRCAQHQGDGAHFHGFFEDQWQACGCNLISGDHSLSLQVDAGSCFLGGVA
jgi:hypothetical protein